MGKHDSTGDYIQRPGRLFRNQQFQAPLSVPANQVVQGSLWSHQEVYPLTAERFRIMTEPDSAVERVRRDVLLLMVTPLLSLVVKAVGYLMAGGSIEGLVNGSAPIQTIDWLDLFLWPILGIVLLLVETIWPSEKKKLIHEIRNHFHQHPPRFGGPPSEGQ